MDVSNKLMLIDNLTLLPYNNFIKCDRMSMSSSLEIRTPFISTDLVLNSLSKGTIEKSTFDNRKYYLKDNFINKKLNSIKKRGKQTFIIPFNSFLKKEAIKLFESEYLINDLFNINSFKKICKEFINDDNYFTFRKFRNLFFK